MRKTLIVSLCATALAYTASVSAHHSFAAYDMQHEVTFVGVVETVEFRNPHISMTLKVKDANGKDKIIHFVEGAPANMLVRMGLKPSYVKTGTKITAIGAPRRDAPEEYFLKTIILEDGTKFQSLK
jgi:hypothetical protein